MDNGVSCTTFYSHFKTCLFLYIEILYTLYTVYIHNRFFCLEVHDMASLHLIAPYT